ncbi:hypothetical protein EIQ28_20875 [Xanthomonas campestris pv. plantaginis]
MIDPGGRHQNGEQAQNQGVVRARSHARRWPDHRLASVAWNPARPRHWRPCGRVARRRRQEQRGCCRTPQTQTGGRLDAPCTGRGRTALLARAAGRASPGAASCPTRSR